MWVASVCIDVCGVLVSGCDGLGRSHVQLHKEAVGLCLLVLFFNLTLVESRQAFHDLVL